MSVDDSLKQYETYLQNIPPRVQEEWIRYYGVKFVLEHIGEARIFEMSDPKPDRNRVKFLTNWLIKARKDQKTIHAQAQYAEELKRRREADRVIEENQGYM
jgi:hypothetical protein